MTYRIAVLALVAALAVPAAASAQDTAVDIEIAFDTTGSMTPSIENAKRDARKIVGDTQQNLPNARFAIVQFRDSGDSPEYEVVQKITASADEVAAAIDKLRAGGGGDSPEAYNLMFRRAVTDPEAIGFRPGARKLIFVLGDAEPHGAGRSGLKGCKDASDDPHKLDTAAALAGLRAAEITLNLILQRSSAQTPLQCYQSMASAAYGNGEATESGEASSGGGGGCTGDAPCPVAGGGGTGPSGAAAPLAPAFERAIAREFPALRWQGVTRGRAGLSIVNHAPKPVRLTTITATLPEGARYRRGSTRGVTRRNPIRHGRRLTWPVHMILDPEARTALSFGVRDARGSFRLAATFRMSGGGRYIARRTGSTTR
jgi:Mg-chelatase subunit ChlD